MKHPAPDKSAAPVGNLALRIFALTVSLLYLPCAFVWAYGFAAFALLLPLFGWVAAHWAERRDRKTGWQISPAQRRLHVLTRLVVLLGQAIAGVALVVTLAAN